MNPVVALLSASTRKRKHKTVHIRHGDLEADVDRQIAPLILEMWRAGIETYQSCQAAPRGWIWVQFDSQVALERFLNIVGIYEPDKKSLHERARYGYDRITSKRRGQWEYVAVVDDLSVEEDDSGDGATEEIYHGYPDYMLLIGMHFPRRDLPTVLRRLVEHNRKNHTL
jgi:hypothetical protein